MILIEMISPESLEAYRKISAWTIAKCS